MTDLIQTGVIGASGYTGLELCALLHRHPRCRLSAATSRKYEGERLSALSPRAPNQTMVHPDAVTYGDLDVAFLCLPHAASAEKAIEALREDTKVIDLSADFRLNDAAVYEKWYGREHPAQEKLSEAVYGLTEHNREALREATLVANPGCYPTSILLPLYPILKERQDIVPPIIADSKSGATGAGRSPKPATLFVEVQDNFRAYKVGAHRHWPEIQQRVGEWSESNPRLHFTPHLLPVRRGILSTIYITFKEEIDEAAVRGAFESVYGQEPFVRLLPAGETPSLRGVTHTNSCVVGLAAVERTLIVTSAIDNLVKGAAGQALQNMNVMFGFEEETGLEKA